MPTYQYRCTSCDTELEAVQKFSDDPLTVCPECRGSLRKVFSAVGVVFKGSGFYATDNRPKGKHHGSKSGDKSDSTSGGKSESKSESKSAEKSESKSDSKSGEKSTSEHKPKSHEAKRASSTGESSAA